MKKMKEEVQAVCKHCGATYLKYRPQQEFCKPICRQRHFWQTLKDEAAIGRKAKEQSHNVAA